jgi:hypothetical protein
LCERFQFQYGPKRYHNYLIKLRKKKKNPTDREALVVKGYGRVIPNQYSPSDLFMMVYVNNISSTKCTARYADGDGPLILEGSVWNNHNRIVVGLSFWGGQEDPLSCAPCALTSY